MSFEDDIFIERFIKNELSKEEETSFLERMETDASFKEKVDLEKQLFDSLNEDSWSFIEDDEYPEVKEYESLLKSKETQDIKNTISQVQSDYSKAQTNKKRNWFLYAAAAVIVVFFSVNLYTSSNESNQDLFAFYLQKTDLLALVDRSESNELSKAQEYFDTKEYAKASAILSQVVDTTENGNVYLYLALSQIALKEYDKAEATLNQFIKSNLLDAQKGYWYKSLLYLKSNQTEKSKKELKTIINNSYFKKEEAKALLKEIQ